MLRRRQRLRHFPQWAARALAITSRLTPQIGGREACHLRAGDDPAGGPSSLLKNPSRHSEDLLIQFFYHESAEACMRGVFSDQGRLFSYISPEARVPANHPLRKIRKLVREPFAALRERRPSFDPAGAIA